ncbi:MAG: RimK family alpha-L-glutamate ligase [Alphaproteobacteria bacterium]
MNNIQTGFTTDAGQQQAYQPLGLAVLLREAIAGNDLTPLEGRLAEQAQRYDDPYALLDLSMVLQLKLQKASALVVQAQALQMRRHYRLKKAHSDQPPVKMLALKAPGDLRANTPFECLIESADLQIDVVYIDRHPLQDMSLPEHDVVLVAACASDENASILAQIATLMSGAGCRVLNRPDCIAQTTRDAAYALLGNVPGICMAHTVRLHRRRILEAASGGFELSDVLDGNYPFIVRPVGSHAGQGLVKVSDKHELAQYVDSTDVQEYYVAPYVDYRDADGLFRKYRIVMIEDMPFVCHMGISSEWMVHYPYAEMVAHLERREEEARLMATFESDFAACHRDAFRMIADLTGLDYVGFDCAETSDGRLLIFEVATAMVVHDLDDPNLFPYKIPQMRRVFDAFYQMLCRAAADSGRSNRPLLGKS